MLKLTFPFQSVSNKNFDAKFKESLTGNLICLDTQFRYWWVQDLYKSNLYGVIKSFDVVGKNKPILCDDSWSLPFLLLRHGDDVPVE